MAVKSRLAFCQFWQFCLTLQFIFHNKHVIIQQRLNASVGSGHIMAEHIQKHRPVLMLSAPDHDHPLETGRFQWILVQTPPKYSAAWRRTEGEKQYAAKVVEFVLVPYLALWCIILSLSCSVNINWHKLSGPHLRARSGPHGLFQISVLFCFWWHSRCTAPKAAHCGNKTCKNSTFVYVL